MQTEIHGTITRYALSCLLGEDDLRAVIRGNLAQDRLAGLIGHPEYHCDDSRFAETEAYIGEQNALCARLLGPDGDRERAMHALGRALHARQDFYAHSNYVPLWVAEHGGLGRCAPADIAPCTDWTSMAQLRSGDSSLAAHLLYAIPGLGSWLLRRRIFAHTHAAMHLDGPERGPMFAYAVSAATKHTRLELERLATECREAGLPVAWEEPGV